MKYITDKHVCIRMRSPSLPNPSGLISQAALKTGSNICTCEMQSCVKPRFWYRKDIADTCFTVHVMYVSVFVIWEQIEVQFVLFWLYKNLTYIYWFTKTCFFCVHNIFIWNWLIVQELLNNYHMLSDIRGSSICTYCTTCI